MISAFVNKKQLTSGSIPSPPFPRREITFVVENDVKLNLNFKKIQPDLSAPLPYIISNRRESTVLSRLHIGHTLLTHSFLFKAEPPPVCVACDDLFTIKHILLDCIDFQDARNEFFSASSLKELFTKTDPRMIFNFLKEINLFYRL